MPVTVDWMDAKYSVIHANFVDDWNWSELYNALETAHSMGARSQHSLTLMFDFIGSQKISSTSTLFEAADTIEPLDILDRVVIVTDDKALGQKMTALLQGIYPNLSRIIVTHSHQEAFERVRSTVEMAAVK